MMFQGWNGQRTKLVCDTGIIQLSISHPQTTSAGSERERERERESPSHTLFHQARLRMEKAGDEELIHAEERTDSESSSGCQSGWTLYLGQSSQESFTSSLQLGTEEEEEEEEDLSMLSDASSGPPLAHENNHCCICNDSFLTFTEVAEYNRDKRRSFEEEKQKRQSFSLEDTASSPLFSCYKVTAIRSSSKKLDVLEQSPNFAESHIKKKKIELQKQLDYLHSICTCESSTGLQRRR